MPSFADNLDSLPKVDHIERIELQHKGGSPGGVIENKPGQQGSLAVYHYLQQTFGLIDSQAASRGLELYAEHTVDARVNPGKHPNIDRLLRVVEGGLPLSVRIIPRAAT